MQSMVWDKCDWPQVCTIAPFSLWNLYLHSICEKREGSSTAPSQLNWDSATFGWGIRSSWGGAWKICLGCPETRVKKRWSTGTTGPSWDWDVWSKMLLILHEMVLMSTDSTVQLKVLKSMFAWIGMSKTSLWLQDSLYFILTQANAQRSLPWVSGEFLSSHEIGVVLFYFQDTLCTLSVMSQSIVWV